MMSRLFMFAAFIFAASALYASDAPVKYKMDYCDTEIGRAHV